jgi:hypothetical protein
MRMDSVVIRYPFVVHFDVATNSKRITQKKVPDTWNFFLRGAFSHYVFIRKGLARA